MTHLPVIDADETHVWVDVPHAPAAGARRTAGQESLSDEERARLRRLVRAEDRLAFTAAHALVRSALSHCVPDVPATAWEFRRTPRGKPEIAAPRVRPPLRFSLSHTRGLVACAVTAGAPCGVDVEAADRATDPMRLARVVCTPRELSWLTGLERAARPAAFCRLWTLKEAYVKARGRGLSLPLSQCGFAVADRVGGTTGIQAEFAPELGERPQEWWLAQWAPTPTHSLAVAVHAGARVAAHRAVLHGVPVARAGQAVPPGGSGR
ncbi:MULTISPECIES: 4'-phosphopantetheinyl transferase family protein [Streptomyces]|uniref:4'-phosphopantetheinyl transferase family protein n=1 Tax=Streptomyces fimbriatus TaxID=68197 RepID=A0ABW0D5U7_STRFI